MSTVGLAHDLRGAGPPLVLLHPLGGDRRVWDPVLEPLSAERTVVVVDLPGFGESPPLTETPTPAALARALLPGRPVLLLDEPTAGLDPEAEDRVLDTLRAQAAAGRIVLIAAHHPRVIAVADQVVRLTVDEVQASAAQTARYEEIPV